MRGSCDSPSVGESGIAEAVPKVVHRSAGVEFVRASRRSPHAHVEEGDLVDIVSRVLRERERNRHLEGCIMPD